MTENRTINLGNGNYNETIEGNYYEQKGNFGIGHMSGGEIKDNAKVAGVINEAEEQNVAEAVAEIQALIQKLEQSHLTNTTSEQMMVATQAIVQIESNPTWKQKAIAAFKQGSLKAIETHLALNSDRQTRLNISETSTNNNQKNQLLFEIKILSDRSYFLVRRGTPHPTFG
jgi:hypothetical protein